MSTLQGSILVSMLVVTHYLASCIVVFIEFMLCKLDKGPGRVAARGLNSPLLQPNEPDCPAVGRHRHTCFVLLQLVPMLASDSGQYCTSHLECSAPSSPLLCLCTNLECPMFSLQAICAQTSPVSKFLGLPNCFKWHNEIVDFSIGM